jgi:hypothetical protein
MPPVHFHIGCISEKLPYLFENAKHWLVTAAILDAREKSVLWGYPFSMISSNENLFPRDKELA